MDERSVFFLLVSFLAAYGAGKFRIACWEKRLFQLRGSLDSLGSDLPVMDPFYLYLVFIGFMKGFLITTLATAMNTGSSWALLVTVFVILGNESVLNIMDDHLQDPFIVFGSMYALYPLEISPLLLGAVTLFLTCGDVYLPVLILLTPALLFLTAGGYDPGIPLTIYFLLLLFWTFLPCRDLLKYHYGQVKSALQRRTVRRKLYRYCGLIFPCIIYPLGGQKALLLSLGIGTLTLWSVELIRKYNPTVRSMIMSVMEPVAKEEEETEITGTSKYILGCFLASIFPDPLNALSIIMLTLGDAWAGLVGRRTGLGIWIKGKSTSGSIACLTACVSASDVFIHMTPSYHLDLEIILAGSLVATLAEGVSGKWDNLFIAPAAALAMWLLL